MPLAAAFVLPVYLFLITLGPLYAGCYAGLIWLYGQKAAELALNPVYQLASYTFLYRHALAHHPSFTGFLLPAFGPPIVGALSGLLFLFFTMRHMKKQGGY